MASILEKVNQPSDLRKLSYEQLDQLAQEARDTIIRIITQRGGHLASNLGIVELTLAIHRVFDSPKDRIVWDTTNQCYTHKLVTGRREQFESVRLEGGLSGFGEPTESDHDVLAAGHAGTGLSVALGVAQAQLVKKQPGWVIAVVGDGGMTSGPSLEAVNNIIGLHPKNLIVILNDNGMSISDNVGFLTGWRQSVVTHPEYRAMVERAKRLTKKMPHGEAAYRLVKRFKASVEGLTLPTTYWAGMGFNYIGPLDGHDIKAMEKAMRQAQRVTDKPALLHVITHKGKGYEPAEQDPVKFHQPSSPLGDGSGAPTYSKVFAQTLARIMKDDPKVVGISAAMLEGTGLVEAKRAFPDRVYDVGIAEEHAMSMAAGLALGGTIPFVSIYSTFMQRAFDQIVHDVCLQNLHVVMIADRAGLVGEDGKTHHGAFDISYIRCIPNSIVCAPKDENELQHLVYTSYKHKAPFAIRIARGAGVGVPLEAELRELPIGKGEVARQGTDVAIVALGKPVTAALQAAEALAKEGISAMVVNARFAKPLDTELLLNAAHSTKRILTVEENVLPGGFGDAVLEALADARVEGVAVERLGMPDTFIEHATAAAQRKRLGLDAEGIAARVRKAFFSNGAAAKRSKAKVGEPAGV
ncbi:MAG: 1-deoxy-D-xylulose-5-phosphate synthase [Chloroflexi bacterium]|nr:1-deoxy-D-xylulose-5-phosphate synthase [Chloroflexota bacterium]